VTKKEEKYIIIGIVLAVLGCVATWLALPQVQSLINAPATSSSTPTTSPNITVIPTRAINLKISSGSQWIRQGQMVVLADQKGVALLRFIFGPEEAAYQWRYRPYNSDTEQVGTGRVYENYALTPLIGGSQVVDLGSVLSIEIADMRVNWSSASSSSGWIYYKSLGLAVLDEAEFNTIDLSTIHLSK
jgi:hypothetical protein